MWYWAQWNYHWLIWSIKEQVCSTICKHIVSSFLTDTHSFCLFFPYIEVFLAGLGSAHLWKQVPLRTSTSWWEALRYHFALPTTQTENESLRLLGVLVGNWPRMTVKGRKMKKPVKRAWGRCPLHSQCLMLGYLSTACFCRVIVSCSAPPTATSDTNSTTRMPSALRWYTPLSCRVGRKAWPQWISKAVGLSNWLPRNL